MSDIVWEKPRSARGFRIFGRRERPDSEVLYGLPLEILVIESSIAMRGPHVRIYEGDDTVHLNLTEAKLVMDALRVFIQEAEAGELTELLEIHEA